MSTTKNGPHNLSDAIHRLESATAGNGKNSLSEDLETIKKALHDIKPQLADMFQETMSNAKETMKKGKEKATELGQNVDEKVHEHPWWAMGLVGLIAFLIGFLVGKKD